MAVLMPDWELGIAGTGDLGFWPKFREDLRALDPIANPTAEQDLIPRATELSAAQTLRRPWLAERPRFLAQEDPVTLEIAKNDVQVYRDTIAAELDHLQMQHYVSTKLTGVLEAEIQYAQNLIAYIEDALEAKGVGRPKVDDIVGRITNKIQLKIALKKKFDELKKQTPLELHSDLERAFRQALEQLDKQ